MKVLALTGYPGCGKDEFFNHVAKTYPELDIRRAAYGDYVKQIHCNRLGIRNLDDYNTILHNRDTQESKELRLGLDQVSKEVKKYNPNALIDYVNGIIAKGKREGADVVIVTDMRYLAEYQDIIRKRYPIIRIHRDTPNDEDIKKPWNEYVDKFVSNYELHNMGTLEEYHNSIISIMQCELIDNMH